MSTTRFEDIVNIIEDDGSEPTFDFCTAIDYIDSDVKFNRLVTSLTCYP